jgi:tetratricopeptide (TPR) repeat protein
LIALAEALEVWPPLLFTNPMQHVLEALEPVVEFPSEASNSKVDVLTQTRQRLGAEAGRWVSEQSVEAELRGYRLGKPVTEARLLALLERVEHFSAEAKDDLYWEFVTMANNFHAHKDDRQSEAHYKNALKVQPEGHEALYNWGVVLAALGDNAGAIAKYAAAVAVKPDKHQALGNWGVALAALGDHAGAIEKFAAAAAVKPDGHEALSNWGVALAALGDHAGAIAKYAAAVAVKPDKHEALSNWGVALAALGDHAGAIEKFAAAVAVKPDGHEALGNWGVALAALGDHAGAVAKYAAAVAVKPDFHEALYNWSNALAHLKEYSAAVEKARAAKAVSGKANYNLACALALTGEDAAAVRELVDCKADGTLPDVSVLDGAADIDRLRGRADYQGFRDGLG